MDTDTPADVDTPIPPVPPAPVERPLRVLNAQKEREARVLLVHIGPDDEAVRAKKLDMAAMVFSGLVPMPLLQSVQQMIDMPGLSPVARLAAIQDTDRKALIDMMRRQAVLAVIEPVLTETDDGDPNHLPVEALSVDQLTAIWEATAMLPLKARSEGARFRGRTRLVAPAPRADGGDVRPTPEHVGVAAPEYEIQHA